jgi:hypothetical protein
MAAQVVAAARRTRFADTNSPQPEGAHVTAADPVITNPGRKPGFRRSALAASGALLTAILPVVVGLVLLASAMLNEPLLARIGPYLPGWTTVQSASRPDSIRRVTIWSGLALIAVGILQGVSELLGLSLFDPARLAIRTVGSLVLISVIVIATTTYLKRHP